MNQSNLPQYARKAFKSGRALVTSLDNPWRRCTQKNRVFRLVDKSYDLDRPDVFGVPFVYEVEEIDFHSYATEEEVVTATYEFKTEE